jgi:hypothetical protein
MVMSIDNIVLAIAVFVLEIIEFKHFKDLAKREGHFKYKDHSLMIPR